jgi:hypothetical protein
MFYIYGKQPESADDVCCSHPSCLSGCKIILMLEVENALISLVGIGTQTVVASLVLVKFTKLTHFDIA